MSLAVTRTLAPAPARRGGRLRRVAAFVWKYLVGTVLCTNPLLSVLVVGWAQRLMQRRTLAYWHARSQAPAQGVSFAVFAAASADTASHVHWPNWVLYPGERGFKRERFKSLWLNAKLGVAAIVNTWVFTLPACVLWLFAWYDGWNNSFVKGYEQAYVGPLTGLLGVALFIAAMFYVPMAQARQASTGHWRSFYEFPLIWTLIRSRWWASVKLGGLYAFLGVLVMALKTAPLGFDRFPGYEALSDADALRLLENYFFWAGAIVFAAYVVVRLVAARIYAGSVLDAVHNGDIEPKRLADSERAILERLDLLHVRATKPRHVVVRAVGGLGRGVTRVAAAAIVAVIWFVFVAEIFVSEFLNYHPVVGWLNQSLVQLPWFRYIPPGLGG